MTTYRTNQREIHMGNSNDPRKQGKSYGDLSPSKQRTAVAQNASSKGKSGKK